MRITRNMKVTALAVTVLLLGLAVACGGDDNASSGSVTATHLVPQRANVVASVNVDQLLEMIDLDLDQLFETLSNETLGGPEGIDEFFSVEPGRTAALFANVSWVDIFAEADVEGESEYFVLVLHGSFDETSLIAELEAISGRDLQRETYKGTTVYTLEDDGDVFALTVLESALFVVGSVEGVKDYIDLIEGDAESASGALIDVYNDLSDGVFGLAARVPQDSFDGEDLGSIPGLGSLPISLDFLSSLEIIGIGGKLDNGSLDIAISMDFTNEEAAETLQGFISGIVTLASGFSPDPRTTELLSSLEVDQEGRRLTITVAIPESELSDILGDLTSNNGTSNSGSGSLPSGTPEITLITTDNVLGEEIALMPSTNHVTEGQAVQYSTIPPTSGMHWGRWAACGWYPDGQPDEVITHNLEHGNIVVSYNFINPAQVSELREVLDDVDKFGSWGVARSYDKIPEGQLVLAAWGRLATFQGVASGEIHLFFEAFAGENGPERIAC